MTMRVQTARVEAVLVALTIISATNGFPSQCPALAGLDVFVVLLGHEYPLFGSHYLPGSGWLWKLLGKQQSPALAIGTM
jgi:hypothetical protein